MATRTKIRYTAVTDKLAKAWHLTSTDRPAGKPFRDKPTVTTYCGKSIWSDPEVGFSSEDLTVVSCGACKRTATFKGLDAQAPEAPAEAKASKAPARKATTARKSGTARKPRQTSRERHLAKDAAKLTVVKAEPSAE